jgi:hypothetical protein
MIGVFGWPARSYAVARARFEAAARVLAPGGEIVVCSSGLERDRVDYALRELALHRWEALNRRARRACRARLARVRDVSSLVTRGITRAIWRRMRSPSPLIRVLFPLLLLGMAACTQVVVAGVTSEGAPNFDPVTNVIVTYTSTTSNVTFNDTSVSPSGAYRIELPEDEYLIQAVHPTCNLSPPVQMLTVQEAFSPYTKNLFLTCP